MGNAIVVRESIEVLARTAEHSADLEELTVELVAEMLVLGGLAEDLAAARETAGTALESGAALQRLGDLIERQGGDPRVIEDPSRLPQPASTLAVQAPAAGWIEGLDARLIGDAALALGAGRTRRSDPLDPAAGIELHAKRGRHVDRDEPWATLYHGAGADLERALDKLATALTLSPDQPAEVHLLKERRS